MLVNPEIKLVLAEIAERSVDLANRPDERKKYVRRLVDFYVNKLSDDEKLFIAMVLCEQLAFKNIIVDPDNIIAIHNVKLRAYLFMAIMAAVLMVIGAALFRTNDSINDVVGFFDKIITMLAF